MQDKAGREYAKLSHLKAGDRVQVDGGFNCMDRDAITQVYMIDDRLYVSCDHGYHFLDGQLEVDGDSLIGVYHVPN